MNKILKIAITTGLFIHQTISPNYFEAYLDSIKASFNRGEQQINADIAKKAHEAKVSSLKYPTSNLSTIASLHRDWIYFHHCKHNTWTPEQRMQYYANQISTIPVSYLVYNMIRCPYTAGPQYPAIAAGVMTFAQLQAYLHRN